MPIDILLVEDNKRDTRLMREMLGEINPTARLHVVTDGAEAMDFLRYQGRYLHATRPNVILLDLNLSKLHGREVLERVKANPDLQTIPVIVLTSSGAEPDVESSYQLTANTDLRKPDSLDEFEQMVICLNAFWFTRVKLAKQKQPAGLALN